MQVTILGNGSGGLFLGRNFTSQLLTLDKEAYLLDCGEGTQHQLFRLGVRYDRVAQIFISHLHSDHVLGLMGILASFGMKHRTAPLAIYGQPGLRKLIETTAEVCSLYLPYPVTVHEVDATQHVMVFESPKLEVWSIPLLHRVPCCGWLFREKARSRKMRADQIEAYKIPFAMIPGIKDGDDFLLPDGQRIPNSELTEAPTPPRAYAFCSDTMYSEQVIEWVKGVDLLYHEATFANDHIEQAKISMHTTAAQAAEVARRAGAGHLLLGHFSGRYENEVQHLEEAKEVFEQVTLAVEGTTYPVRK